MGLCNQQASIASLGISHLMHTPGTRRRGVARFSRKLLHQDFEKLSQINGRLISEPHMQRRLPRNAEAVHASVASH